LGTLWQRVARETGFEEVAGLEDPENRRWNLTRVLDARPRTLLVLDNIERAFSTKTAVDTLARGKTVLLLTARTNVAAGRPQSFEVPSQLEPAAKGQAASQDPAVTLFEETLTQNDPTRPNAKDRQYVAQVVAALGRHPHSIVIKA